MNKLNLVFALCATVLVSACESEPDENLQSSIDENKGVVTNFDPANSIIPFPNDLLFQGSLDGTLNIPVDDPADLSNPRVAMNALDGFSTVAPMTTGFTDALDASSINGDSVRVYEVTLTSSPSPGGAVTAVNNKLTYGVDYFAALSSVDSSDSTLVILPLKPLAPKSHYYVAVTKALKAADGSTVGTSAGYALTKGLAPLHVGGVSTIPQTLSDAQAQSLEPLRQLISTSEAVTAALDTSMDVSDIIVSWSFTTQSAGDVLTVVRNLCALGPGSTSLSPLPFNLGAGPGSSVLGAANVHTGTIEVSYYLTAATGVNDPTPLGSYWQSANAFAGENNLTNLNPLPAATETRTIPLLVTTPVDTVSFPPPWRTVIFQHGITSNRTAALGMVDSLAQAGFAVVAIDMPMHGLVDSNSPLYSAGIERTFDLDLVTQDANDSITAAAPDGVTDSSGVHYINLSNLLNTRDNVRQSVGDLFEVAAAIPNMFVAGGNYLDADNIYFVGHSLGAMVGTVFTALEPNVKDAVFAFGGASLPKILDGSAAFGPIIAAGLAANGVLKGTTDYEAFLGAAQTVVDSGDPANYAAASATGRGVLFFEIVGGNGSPSDLVVPNAVSDGNDSSGTVPAPLAGTEPQLALMGLTHVNRSQGPGTADLKVVTKFTSGDHRSLLDPTADPLVTTEIQTQAANFLGSGGVFLKVTDDSVLLAPPVQF